MIPIITITISARPSSDVCDLFDVRVLQGKTFYGEGAYAGALTVPKKRVVRWGGKAEDDHHCCVPQRPAGFVGSCIA